MKRIVALLMIAGALLAGGASAQSSALRVGDRIRITTIHDSSLVGRLVQADDFHITVVTAAATEHTIDRPSIALIERSQGTAPNIRKGALVGMSLGALTGLAVGYNGRMKSGGSGPLLIGPIALGAAGVLIGASIGGAGGERWTLLPLDARIGLQLGGPSVPFAIGIQASF